MEKRKQRNQNQNIKEIKQRKEEKQGKEIKSNNMKRLFANEYYDNCCNKTSVSVKKINAINGYKSFICRENTPETKTILYPYGKYVVGPVDLKNICEEPRLVLYL
jgi:hypothetical protein